MTGPPATSSPDRVTCCDQRIERDDAPGIAVRIYTGRDHRAGAPLVLHFHAGAFVRGSLDSGAAVARLLAHAGARVVSVDYPLAPAHPFPEAAEAGHAALVWLSHERRRLSAARAPLVVAGEESGGNLATAVAMMARDRCSAPVAGQILLSPMLDACVATASLRGARAGPVGCRWADGWHDYLPRAEDAMHPYAVPGRSMRLAGLPRTLLITAEDDPLRDETQAYARRLRDAAVAVDAAVLPIATGWPLSYVQSWPPSPGWGEAVRERLRRFLHEREPGGAGA